MLGSVGHETVGRSSSHGVQFQLQRLAGIELYKCLVSLALCAASLRSLYCLMSFKLSANLAFQDLSGCASMAVCHSASINVLSVSSVNRKM